MEIYFSTFLLLSCTGLLSIYIRSRKSLIICLPPLLLMIYQMGFRWEMGTDWQVYYNNFIESSNIDQAILNSALGFEPGYGILAVLSHKISDDYTIFLVITSIIFYTLSFSAIRKLSPYPIASLMLFYGLTIGILGSNRQLIALSICLFSIRYLILNEGRKFWLSIALAMTFHLSAIIFSVYYFLDREIKLSRLIIVLSLGILVGSTSIPTIAFESLGGIFGGIIAYKAKYYTDNSNLVIDQLSAVGTVRRILIFLILLNIKWRLPGREQIFRILFNGYCVGIFIYLLFGRALLILANRGSIYFNIMEAFLLAYSLTLVRTRIERYIVFSILIIYSLLMFFQGIAGYPDLFIPFQGVHINTGYQRYLY